MSSRRDQIRFIIHQTIEMALERALIKNRFIIVEDTFTKFYDQIEGKTKEKERLHSMFEQNLSFSIVSLIDSYLNKSKFLKAFH